jgi:hypothetical protein
MELNIENNKDFISKPPEAGQEEAKQENEKRREEIIEKYLQYFIDCRDNYIDEIPDKIIRRSEDPKEDKKYYFYKCRKNFFTHIVGNLGLMVEMEIIKDPELINKINEFRKYVKENITPEEKITKEDIDKVNEIINYAIEILS